MYKADNAIIMAAGFASRFVPLSYEIPKGLIKVRGEVLIERQIRQLKEAGIDEIIIVTGHKKECFEYLRKKENVILIENKEYSIRNNHSSIHAAKDYIKNSYICSCDDYFPENPFEKYVAESYYCAMYSKGETQEWGVELDNNDKILSSKPGGYNQWYIIGHAFWDENFSRDFLKVLEKDYNKKEIYPKLWDEVYLDNTDCLSLKIRKYPDNFLFEFDTIDELRRFDSSYIDDTKSEIIKNISKKLSSAQRNITSFKIAKKDNKITGFYFKCENKNYLYTFDDGNIKDG